MDLKKEWSLWKTAHKLTQDLSWNLAVKNPEGGLYYKYWDAYNCDDIDGFRCNKKWCYWCNMKWSVKTATNYLDELLAFKDAHFVTITSTPIEYNQLSKEKIRDYQQKVGAVIKAARRKIEGKGIRKFEITYSRNSSTPKIKLHYHMIVDSLELGQEIINGWLKVNPDCTRKAQDLRELKNKKDVQNALFYCCKSPVPIYKNSNYNVLDKIYDSIGGARMIQHFGLTKAECSDDRKEEIKQEVYSWQADWWKDEPHLKRKPYHKDKEEFKKKLELVMEEIETRFYQEVVPKLSKAFDKVELKFPNVSLKSFPKSPNEIESYFNKKKLIEKEVKLIFKPYLMQSANRIEIEKWESLQMTSALSVESWTWKNDRTIQLRVPIIDKTT